MNAKKAKLIRKKLKDNGINVKDSVYYEDKDTIRVVPIHDVKGEVVGGIPTSTAKLEPDCGRKVYKDVKKAMSV